jgi:hypothetical protein
VLVCDEVKSLWLSFHPLKVLIFDEMMVELNQIFD